MCPNQIERVELDQIKFNVKNNIYGNVITQFKSFQFINEKLDLVLKLVYPWKLFNTGNMYIIIERQNVMYEKKKKIEHDHKIDGLKKNIS